jgi:ABC-2 type transport system permease protein
MLDTRKVKIILRKEWAEVFKNKMVIFTIIFMPLLFSALPLIMLGTTSNIGVTEDMSTELPQQFTQMCPEGITGGECFQVYLATQFLLLFMMIPLIIPVNIAAYSIVGEKTTRSLEPLLATPVTTAELLVGKNLASVIPAILGTWLGFLVFAIGAAIIVNNPIVMGALLAPTWLLAIFLIGPLLAVLSVNFSLMVSSRVNDPRVAEQVSAVIIVPVLGLFFGQISGLFLVNQNIILIMAAVLVAVDAGVLLLAVRFFQRETILTRWK